MHSQSLQEAPASVTVLTADDLYHYGYRTLTEALGSVKGFFTTNDRTYQSVGVRGFGIPGDYASRILVMVNGHNMADNVFDSMLWFGTDFPVEMNLIKRLEIIRGPSSALYGSSGVFATINIVTKSPDEGGVPTLTLDTGSFGEKKAQLSGGFRLGSTAQALVSASIFNNGGESPLHFSQLDSGQPGSGREFGMDAQSGYHIFSNLVIKNWSFVAVLSKRTKIQPISWGPTAFNDTGTKVIEPSNYVEATYTRQSGDRTLRWRTYYSSTHLRGRFDYPVGSVIENNQTCSCGDWIGTELTYRSDFRRYGAVTVGVEGKADLRVIQSSADVAPTPIQFINIDQRDRSLALFAQHELDLSSHWKLDWGLRADFSAYRRSFLSPRVAVIYQPSDLWTWKVLYGRAFRNPSAFHLFFEDGISAVANPGLRPENIDTVEVNIERKLGKSLSVLGAAYGYSLRDLLAGVYTSDGLLQYQNLGGMRAAGVELEITSRPSERIEANASYTFQRATDSLSGSVLPNSANHQAKARVLVSIGRKLFASSSLQYYSSRQTLAGATLDGVFLTDFTITTRGLLPNLDLQFGVRNAFNRNYYDPVALNPIVDSMQQPGRSFYVELIAHAAK